MQILRQTIFTAVIALLCINSHAQNDAAMQKAFSDSYTQEYYKKYPEAIATISKVNSDDNYETNLRLGWLNYLNKNYKKL
jgi:hypothetical protein